MTTATVDYNTTCDFELCLHWSSEQSEISEAFPLREKGTKRKYNQMIKKSGWKRFSNKDMCPECYAIFEKMSLSEKNSVIFATEPNTSKESI